MALGILIWPALAGASPQVTWSAPEECGNAAAFSEAVQRELGDRTLPGAVRIEVRSRGNGYAMRLEMSVSGEAGTQVLERQLLAPTCSELRAAALSVLLVSATEPTTSPPVLEVAVPAPASAAPPSGLPPSASPLPAPDLTALSPPQKNNAEPADNRDFWRFAWEPRGPLIGLGVGIESGRVGEAVPRLQGHLRLPLLNSSVGKLGVALGGLYVPPQRHAVDADRGGDLSRTALRLGPTLLVEQGIEPLSLQLAFQGELGRVTGSGYGVTSPTTRGVWRSALLAEGEIGVAFERLALGLWGEASLARDDSRYVLEGLGEVYRPSILALGGGLRAWLRFP